MNKKYLMISKLKLPQGKYSVKFRLCTTWWSITQTGMKFVELEKWLNQVYSAQDPINFDADPDPDPGYFFKIF